MKKLTEYLISWTKDYFSKNDVKYAVIGLSGGKDSTITAAILKEAIGEKRIIAVQMPNGVQKDIADSTEVMNILNIPEENRYLVDISSSYSSSLNSTFKRGEEINDVIKTNLPSRLRMCTLYNIAAYYKNARVISTSNYSEVYVGYMTKFGDAGDVCLLYSLTVSEVIKVGEDLNLPKHLVYKTPSDGMSGKSDEENLGFSYKDLDRYIKEGSIDDKDTEEKIKRRYLLNLHKHEVIAHPVINDELKEDL